MELRSFDDANIQDLVNVMGTQYNPKIIFQIYNFGKSPS